MRSIELSMEVEEEDGVFVSTCPELGTASCGDTVQEATENLIEAVLLHLSGLKEVGTEERVFRERGIKVKHSPDDDPAVAPSQADCNVNVIAQKAKLSLALSP